jgi:pimeloyl-ACP methyl ester carboxylesterase
MPEIAHSSLGEGKPLILIHGFCETKELWEDFQATMSNSFQVICPDLPGFGESPLPRGGALNLDIVAEHLMKWWDNLGIKDPIVVGHSLGGYVALAMLAKAPEKIKAMGLFHSTAFSDDEAKKKARDKTVKFVENYGTAPFVENFIPQLFPQDQHERQKDVINKLVQNGMDTPMETIVAYALAMRDRPDRVEVLKNFSGKKCFIAGEFDTAVSITASRKHQDLVDDYLELKQCGHMGMFEKPNETLVFLQQFVARASRQNG